MVIQGVVRNNNGCEWHRIVNPLAHLQMDKEWSQNNSVDILWIAQGEWAIDCDVLMYNKFIWTSIEELREMQNKGMKVVVDIDDYWVLPKTSVHYKNWMTIVGSTQQKSNCDLTLDHIKNADLVTCTSLKLQEKIREYNKNTIVIPNALPFIQDTISEKEPHQKMAFLYAGGVDHLVDVELLKFPFKKIGGTLYSKRDNDIKEKAEFIIAGYDKAKQKLYHSKQDRELQNDNFTITDVRGPYDDMVSIFASTGSHKVIPTAHVSQYMKCYEQADVVLCPLHNTGWNSMKSVLKIIEAANYKLPVICSQVAPYYPLLKGYPGILWVDQSNQWLEHINWCIKYPDQVKVLGDQLYMKCKENFDMKIWNDVRKQIFATL